MMLRPSVQAAAIIMLEELHDRLQKIFDCSEPGHESIYLVATMLDPRFKQLFTSGQTEHAKKEFLRYIKNDESDDSDTPVTSAVAPALLMDHLRNV